MDTKVTEARIGRLRRELKLPRSHRRCNRFLFASFYSTGSSGSKPPLIASMMIEVSWIPKWPFWTFSRRFRDSPEDAFWGTSGAPGELIWGRIGAQLRSIRSSFSK